VGAGNDRIGLVHRADVRGTRTFRLGRDKARPKIASIDRRRTRTLRASIGGGWLRLRVRQRCREEQLQKRRRLPSSNRVPRHLATASEKTETTNSRSIIVAGYRAQAFVSHLSFALASRIVCHCRLETASGAPQASGKTWSLTYPGHAPLVRPVTGHGRVSWNSRLCGQRHLPAY